MLLQLLNRYIPTASTFEDNPDIIFFYFIPWWKCIGGREKKKAPDNLKQNSGGNGAFVAEVRFQQIFLSWF